MLYFCARNPYFRTRVDLIRLTGDFRYRGTRLPSRRDARSAARFCDRAVNTRDATPIGALKAIVWSVRPASKDRSNLAALINQRESCTMDPNDNIERP
jgi:hypothetical protein